MAIIATEEQEIELLDVLVVLAGNIKLLLLGPLAGGLAALGIAFAVPQSYTSQAILASLPAAQQSAALMASPLVLDPVIESMGLRQGQSMEEARTRLGKRIKATVGKDNLLRLDATAPSPDDARKLANAVIDTWLKSTIPTGQEKEDLQQRLVLAKTALDSIQRLLDRLPTEGVANLGKPLTWGAAGTSLASIHELQARYLNDVLSIPRQIKGLSRDVVVKQAPTLPTEPSAPRKGVVGLLAALVAGFVLSLWVFLRQAWLRATQDPVSAAKQQRVLAALGWRAQSEAEG